MDDQERRTIVAEKLKAKRIAGALQSAKRRWWKPLLPAGLSASLGAGLLAIAFKQPGDNSNTLLAGVVFLAVAYMCFWVYRQNCILRALAEKQEGIEARLEEIAGEHDAARRD